ncbi:MAG TPA: hypothetical protein VFQ35_26730, partial [Polyangiaceae bacterium]|nr:hypothetical protein [Polyangiaceae bacterium]
EESPRAFASSLLVLDFLLTGPTEIVLALDGESTSGEGLARALASRFLPSRVQTVVSASRPNPTRLARDKGPVEGRAAVYVCRDFACQRPVTEPAELLPMLDADQRQRTAREALRRDDAV